MDFCSVTVLHYLIHITCIRSLVLSLLLTLQAPLSQKPKVLYLAKKDKHHNHCYHLAREHYISFLRPHFHHSISFCLFFFYHNPFSCISLLIFPLSLFLSAAECSGCQLRADLCPQAMPQPLPASYLEPACIMHHGCVVPLCAGKQGCRAGNSSLLIGSGGRLRQSIENRRHTGTQMRTLTHKVM